MSAMDAKVLRRAAELIDQGWCRGGWQQDAEGRAVRDYDDPRAAKWCMHGAILRARHEIGATSATSQRATEAVQRVAGGSVLVFNDLVAKSADEVAAKLRAAADRCDASEA